MSEPSSRDGQRPSGAANGNRTPGGRATRTGRVLAVVGGMRPDLVDGFPGERRDRIQTALTLLVTTLVAYLSGAIAVGFALSSPGDAPMPWWVVVLGGLIWALAVFGINRALVLSLEERRGRQVLAPVVVALAVTTLIAIVVSTPLVLQVFSSEIRSEIALLNQEKANDSIGMMAPFERAVTDATTTVDARRRQLDAARSGPSIDRDPAYQDALKASHDATAACSQAQLKATREFRGELPASEGGSGMAGGGDLYRLLQSQANQACAVATEKKTTLDAAAKAAQRTPEQIQDGIMSADAALHDAQESLAQAIEARDEAAARSAQVARGYGVLIRLEALSALSQRNATAGLVHYSIVALFVAIGVLPVGLKAFTQWRDELTPYEVYSRNTAGAPLVSPVEEQESADV